MSPKNRRVQNRVCSVRAAGQQRVVAYLEEALCRFTKSVPKVYELGCGSKLDHQGERLLTSSFQHPATKAHSIQHAGYLQNEDLAALTPDADFMVRHRTACQKALSLSLQMFLEGQVTQENHVLWGKQIDLISGISEAAMPCARAMGREEGSPDNNQGPVAKLTTRDSSKADDEMQ